MKQKSRKEFNVQGKTWHDDEEHEREKTSLSLVSACVSLL